MITIHATKPLNKMSDEELIEFMGEWNGFTTGQAALVEAILRIWRKCDQTKS